MRNLSSEIPRSNAHSDLFISEILTGDLLCFQLPSVGETVTYK